MDSETIQYYNDRGDELAAIYARSKGEPAKYFKVAFPPDSEIVVVMVGFSF
jgi:hypothetical protein